MILSTAISVLILALGGSSGPVVGVATVSEGLRAIETGPGEIQYLEDAAIWQLKRVSRMPRSGNGSNHANRIVSIF